MASTVDIPNGQTGKWKHKYKMDYKRGIGDKMKISYIENKTICSRSCAYMFCSKKCKYQESNHLLWSILLPLDNSNKYVPNALNHKKLDEKRTWYKNYFGQLNMRQNSLLLTHSGIASTGPTLNSEQLCVVLRECQNEDSDSDKHPFQCPMNTRTHICVQYRSLSSSRFTLLSS